MNRLELNTTSGDLTIKKLSAIDDMEYRVSLEEQGHTEEKTSSVRLIVRGEKCFYQAALIVIIQNYGTPIL